MQVTATKLPEVLIIEPDVFEDPRGFFYESYSYGKYAALGIREQFLQDNHSRSTRGVLRGLHYQAEPGQAKLVRVAMGSVFDVAVDVRWGSPTFGEWVGIELSAENRRQLYIPVGFAHGFCVTSDVAELLYKVSSYYAPELERGIVWNDKDMAIDWPVADPSLSERDRKHPRLLQSGQDFVFCPPGP